jgi:hypothetical protein
MDVVVVLGGGSRDGYAVSGDEGWIPACAFHSVSSGGACFRAEVFGRVIEDGRQVLQGR